MLYNMLYCWHQSKKAGESYEALYVQYVIDMFPMFYFTAFLVRSQLKKR